MSQEHVTPKSAEEMDKKPPSISNSKKHSTFLGIAIFSLLVAIATAILVIYVYKIHVQPYLVSPQQTLADEKKISDIQQTVFSQQQVLNKLQKELNQYQHEKQSNATGLDEVEYLIKLAMFNLNFGGNDSIARQLLQTADEKINSLGDSIYWPLRQAIAKDIAALDAVSKVDLPGVVSRLNALSEQVETLPHNLIPAEKSAAQPEALSSPSEVTSIKQRFQMAGKQMLEILNRLVIVTRDTPNTAPLLPPDQYVYVMTNIQSKLSVAEWAVLYHQPTIYQQSLMQAKQWISRYFTDSSSQVKAYVKSLEELMAVTVKPAFPDLSETLNIIKQLKNNASHAPSPPSVMPHSESIRI